MKTKLFFIALIILLSTFRTTAQYTKLLDFTGTTNGRNPYGSLFSDGTYFYGMTAYGGTLDNGTIFKMLPDGTGYSKLLDFAGTNGQNPRGSLISDGTFLYGMTSSGGAHINGTIFKIMPDGTGYVDLFDFAGISNGGTPFGSLIFDGTFLYGMTLAGGANDYGVIFKIKTDGTAYDTLLSFGTDGLWPEGNLFSDGTFLYGMTRSGGTSVNGTIFKIMPDGTGYSKLLDFNGTNGQNPQGTLISDGTFLYGLTALGGANNLGVLFKIMPDGTGYSKLLDFNGTNGSKPQNDLFYDGTFLYGMTFQGGPTDHGVFFKIKPDGTGYVDLFDFSGVPTGRFPCGSLISDGTALYGMAVSGGLGYCSGGCGTIFKYHPAGMGIEDNQLQANLAIYPNPTSGLFNLKIEQSEKFRIQELEVYNVLGECVYQAMNMQTANEQIDLSYLHNGVYIIQIQAEQGTTIQKIIIQK